MPFASALWAALAAALQHQSEAPPGRVACVRFREAARWFHELMCSNSTENQWKLSPPNPRTRHAMTPCGTTAEQNLRSIAGATARNERHPESPESTKMRCPMSGHP
eukprot:1688370-Amphidinium_carterae.1